MIYCYVDVNYNNKKTNMVDILDETIESIRQEKIENALKKYGVIFIVALLLFLGVGTLGVWWQGYKEEKIKAQGGDFVTAMMKARARNFDEAQEKLTKLMNDESSNSSYSAISGLNLAAIFEGKGEITKHLQFIKRFHLIVKLLKFLEITQH